MCGSDPVCPVYSANDILIAAVNSTWNYGIECNTTTTTTTTVTPTTTTTTTTVIGLFVDSISSNACAGIGTSLPTYSYTGTATLCGCTSLNAANATSLSAGTYYVSDGVDTRQFTSTGGGSTLLTAAGACVSC